MFVRLLTRSATGERITQYTSQFTKPRDGGEMHIVLVDNGRSARLADERFWPSLKCIRCGVCMNTCPVYRRSGGLSYGGTYMGPIGIITMPAADIRRYRELPFASTINGSCSNVCPVDIDIHEQIYEWRSLDGRPRAVLDREEGRDEGRRQAAEPPAGLSRRDRGRRPCPEGVAALALCSQLNAWGRRRDVPEAPKETFHQWYARTRGRDWRNDVPATRDRRSGHVARVALMARFRRVPVVPPLPLVPDFTSGAEDLVALFSAALERLDGKVVTATPSGIQSWLVEAFPDARSICSATGEVAGNVDPSVFSDWAAPADVDVTVVRTPMGVAETGSILLTETELAVTTAAVLPRHLVVLLDPADIVENIHVAYRHPAFEDAAYAVLLSGPSGSADIGGVTVHPAQGVTTLTAVLAPRIAGCAPE